MFPTATETSSVRISPPPTMQLQKKNLIINSFIIIISKFQHCISRMHLTTQKHMEPKQD